MTRFRSLALPLLLVSASVATLGASPAAAQFALDIRVDFAPPPLPVYVQPPLPGPDFIWTPGYWAWDPGIGDYYWVPGTWVRAPRPGYLWTPAWWGWDSGVYRFHRGYWGPHVGYYGGVAYGFGYTGVGFFGGRWDGDHFAYNRTVNNITNVHVTNIYEERIDERRVTNVSYNGGPGGVRAEPTPEQRAAERGPRIDPTPDQERHVAAAQGNRALFAGANHGAPPIAATPRPAAFNAPSIARGARPGEMPPPIAHGARPEGFGGPAAGDRGGDLDNPRQGGGNPRGAEPYRPHGRDGGDPYGNGDPRNGGNPHPNGGRPPGFDGGPPPHPQGNPHPPGQPHQPGPPHPPGPPPPHPQPPREGPHPQPRGEPHNPNERPR